MKPDAPSRRATLIESLGVYLPPREVRTEELVQGCVHKVGFPLERMSGIESRHVAGETEFSIDLAAQAVTRCLARSRHRPEDVELLISASIARVDGPGLWITHEPSTALELRRRFGFDRAIVFDVASACSGMFTAISIADTLLRRGVIECGLVVSGEYISHLGVTAQKEITEFLDPRLSCLTLGDAGAAVMLEATDVPGRGFDALELTTFGAYGRYCVAYPTREPHGGAIMLTDALKLTEAATRHGAAHALGVLDRAGWTTDSFQHLIMHQTSRTALTGAMREINRLVGRVVCHPGNTIDNLARRGNTASTSHFVALADGLANGRIRSGDRVVFAVSGSGLTVGTALYNVDDLPERIRQPAVAERRQPVIRSPNGGRRNESPLVRIESVGTVPAPAPGREDTLTLLRRAAVDCLEKSALRRSDLGLLIHAGVYRTSYLTEPAIAALLAGELDINATQSAGDDRGTLAFDVFNGAVGFLNACHVAAEAIRAGRVAAAMVVTAEIENNADDFPQELLGLEETGSAVILTRSTVSGGGLGAFLFRSFAEYAGAVATHCINRYGTTRLVVSRDPCVEDHYLHCIVAAASELLDSQALGIEQIATILPPQISAEFITRLSRALGVPRARFVDATAGRRDLFTSSLPVGWRVMLDQGIGRPGDIALLVAVGSGIQVGCALYHR